MIGMKMLRRGKLHDEVYTNKSEWFTAENTMKWMIKLDLEKTLNFVKIHDDWINTENIGQGKELNWYI